MIKSVILALIFLTSGFPNFHKVENQSADWEILFNGKDLSGWDTWLGMPYEESKDLWQQTQAADYKPFGLNNDPLGVFTVVEVDGEPALRFSGEVFGGISTVAEYENYHLQLQFKWGKEKYAPKLNNPRDSGILYHGNGEQGVESGFWLRSQEFQIQEGDCGDYWGVAGGQMDIHTEKVNDSLYRYNPEGELKNFGYQAKLGRNVKKGPNGEKPTGEWNTLDLYCYGDKSAHVVNGVVTMILENSQLVLDGVKKPLTRGKIQLQTEGAEIYYRNIKIRSIDNFPKKF